MIVLFLGINICFLTNSCGQTPPPACSEILALEKQIDGIERQSAEVAKRIYPNEPFNGVWEQYPTKRPSVDPDFNKVCDPTIKVKPLLDLAKYKKGLTDLRDKAMDQNTMYLEEEVRRQNGGSFQENSGTNNNQGSGFGLEKKTSNETMQEDTGPDNFISGPIAYDKKAGFDVIDDVEYGREDNPKKYICAIYDPRSKEFLIDFVYKVKIRRDNKDTWIPAETFDRTIKYMKQNKRDPVFLMNAGIFNTNLQPLGLFYRNSKQEASFNNKTGLDGNFYMQPAGVFVIKDDGTAKIITRQALSENMKDTATFKFATQSGPMLVIDGKPHKDFKSKSTNLNIRNGVGIMPDGKIIFAMSKQEVSFYEFALLFRDGFKCENAMYLDGFISKVYAPDIQRFDIGGSFSGIIAIYKPGK